MKRLLAALILGLASTACNPGNSTSSVITNPPPTTPAPAVTTEIFSGTVDPAGRAIHPFTITLSGGQITVNLTAAGPPASIFMGLGVGLYSSADASCALLTNGSVVTPAGTTPQLAGTLNAGAYCVLVYDAGNQTAQVSYSVTVNHY
jgi:hypothetical protein